VISGAHVIFTARTPEADRAFFRTSSDYAWTPVRWLIFSLPQLEAAVPSVGRRLCCELYFIAAILKRNGISCEEGVSCLPRRNHDGFP